MRYYDITIIEQDGTIETMVISSRIKALAVTNVAENVRKCKAWRITYQSNLSTSNCK